MGRICAMKGCGKSTYNIERWKQLVCEVHNCRHASGECDCPKPFQLYTFPADTDRRAAWTALVNRKVETRSGVVRNWAPNQDSRVCSKHFVEGKPTEKHPNPTFYLGHQLRKGNVPPRRGVTKTMTRSNGAINHVHDVSQGLHDWIPQCLNVLEILLAEKENIGFQTPAPTNHLYYDLIAEPMDLTSVKLNLEKHIYKTLAAFRRDMRLVFVNLMSWSKYKHGIDSDGIATISEMYEELILTIISNHTLMLEAEEKRRNAKQLKWKQPTLTFSSRGMLSIQTSKTGRNRVVNKATMLAKVLPSQRVTCVPNKAVGCLSGANNTVNSTILTQPTRPAHVPETCPPNKPSRPSGAQPLTNEAPQAVCPPHSPSTGCVHGATTTITYTKPSFWVLPNTELLFLTDEHPAQACMTSRDYRARCYPPDRLDFRLSKFKSRRAFEKYVEKQQEEYAQFTGAAVPCLEVPHSGFSAPAVHRGLGKAPRTFDYNILRSHFSENPYPTEERIKEIADHMQFPLTLIKRYFRGRRSTFRLKIQKKLRFNMDTSPAPDSGCLQYEDTKSGITRCSTQDKPGQPMEIVDNRSLRVFARADWHLNQEAWDMLFWRDREDGGAKGLLPPGDAGKDAGGGGYTDQLITFGLTVVEEVQVSDSHGLEPTHPTLPQLSRSPLPRRKH